MQRRPPLSTPLSPPPALPYFFFLVNNCNSFMMDPSILYPLPILPVLQGNKSDFSMNEYDVSDEDFITDEEIQNMNSNKRRRRTYYSSSDEDDLNLKRIPKKKKRSFHDINEDIFEPMTYHHPPFKRQKNRHNHNTMHINLLDDLPSHIHFPTQTNISSPHIETATDFSDLQRFNEEIKISYNQLCCIKKQFQKYLHEKQEDRKNHKTFLLGANTNSMYGITTKISMINKKIAELKQEQQIINIKSVVKDDKLGNKYSG
eukprot:211436_1